MTTKYAVAQRPLGTLCLHLQTYATLLYTSFSLLSLELYTVFRWQLIMIMPAAQLSLALLQSFDSKANLSSSLCYTHQRREAGPYQSTLLWCRVDFRAPATVHQILACVVFLEKQTNISYLLSPSHTSVYFCWRCHRLVNACKRLTTLKVIWTCRMHVGTWFEFQNSRCLPHHMGHMFLSKLSSLNRINAWFI